MNNTPDVESNLMNRWAPALLARLARLRTISVGESLLLDRLFSEDIFTDTGI